MLWTAINHHKTHKLENITFEKRPYLVDIYRDDSDYLIIEKATQCGVSEYLIVRAITRTATGRNIFYVLPTYDLVGRFVTNRVNRAILVVPYYEQLISKSDVAVATGALLKHIGNGAISFVGSNSSAPFTEFPADELIIDELDQCNEDNVHMAMERLSASKSPAICKVSNPTIPNRQIDYEYSKTDKKQWFLRHTCGEWFMPDFFEHVVMKVEEGTYIIRDKAYKTGTKRDVYPICPKCHKPYDRFSPGQWVAAERSDKSGYHISKMFSTEMTLLAMIDRFNDGLVNPTAMQRFFNGDLGVAYTDAGAKITEEMLDLCREEYMIEQICHTPTYMGIDVGVFFHVIIRDYESRRAVFIGKVKDPEDVIRLYRDFSVRMAVIDALPETRISRKLIATLKMMFMAFYGGEKGESVNFGDKIITAPRTETLDAVREGFVLRTLKLPANASTIDGYYPQLTSSVRVYDEKKDKYDWVEGAKEDHYFHAEAYAHLARKLLSLARR